MAAMKLFDLLGGLFQKKPGWREQMHPMQTRNIIPDLEADALAKRRMYGGY